jgi:tetratricopeptide (TPR) repeat protein
LGFPFDLYRVVKLFVLFHALVHIGTASAGVGNASAQPLLARCSRVSSVGAAPQMARSTGQGLCIRLADTMQMQLADGRSVLPGGTRPRALVALLALAPGHRMPRRLLAGLLWSGAEARHALGRLRDVLHDLRAALQAEGLDILGADASSLWLLADAVTVEAAERSAGWPFLSELRGIDPQLDDWLDRAEGGPGRPPAIEARAQPDRAVPPAMRRASVLVAPLNNLAGPRAGHLDIAATDAIVAAMSALRSVSVLVDVPGRPPPTPDYMLTGNIHLAGQRPQVSLRLVDVGGGGAVLWSSVIAPDEARPSAFAEEVAAQACARLEHELLLLEAERATLRPLAEASAQEMVLRVVPDIYRLERDAFERAGKVLAMAVRREPRLASAHAWLAYWNVLLVGQGWAGQEREALAAAGQAAEQAILLDPRDARGLAIAGHVRGFLHHQVPEALALTRQALEINPALPAGWTFSGMAHAYGGELETARRHLKRALALLPRNPHAFFTEAGLATVEMLLGNFEATLEIGRAVLQLQPRFTAALRAQIAALGHLGRAEEARPLVHAMLDLDPGFTLPRFRNAAPYVRRRDMDHFLRGLRLAGMS